MYTLDHVSNLLFGRSLRLRVARWILLRDAPDFFQSEAATGIGYAPSGVREELNRMVQLGMLVRHEPTPGDRRRYYVRTDSPLWNIVRAALAAIDELSAKQETS